MDVGDWLRSLGLGQYETMFRENEIDAEVLPELTEADLEKIGVPLGHLKRLLKAVATLSAAEDVAKPTSSGPTQPFTDAAERSHGGRGGVEVTPHQISPVLGIELRREARRADEVAEHHRDRTALGDIS